MKSSFSAANYESMKSSILRWVSCWRIRSRDGFPPRGLDDWLLAPLAGGDGGIDSKLASDTITLYIFICR